MNPYKLHAVASDQLKLEAEIVLLNIKALSLLYSIIFYVMTITHVKIGNQLYVEVTCEFLMLEKLISKGGGA